MRPADKVGRVIPNAPRRFVIASGLSSTRRVKDNPPYLGPGAIIALLAFFFAPFLRADTTVNLPSTPGSGITVRLSTPLTQMPHFGFLPVKVFVENVSVRD